jgi:hypothetical protein
VSVGGIVKFTVKPSAKTEPITSAAANFAVVDEYEYGYGADIEIEGDQITLANLARAFAGTLSTTTTTDDTMTAGTGGGGLKTKYQVFVYGLKADGQAKKMSIPAMTFKTDGEIAPTMKQQTWQCKGSALFQTAINGVFQYLPNPAVTTAPTFASCNPASGSTSASKTAGIAITFAVALDAADVTTDHIFMLKDSDSTFVPCTISQAGAVVSLVPVSALSGTTKYRVVIVPGLKSGYGVPNPLGYEKSFTTVA